MRVLAVTVLAVVLVLAMTVPAFAVNGSNGAGLDFGMHHATHAQEMTGFTGEDNPGMHRGFARWNDD